MIHDNGDNLGRYRWWGNPQKVSVSLVDCLWRCSWIIVAILNTWSPSQDYLLHCLSNTCSLSSHCPSWSDGCPCFSSESPGSSGHSSLSQICPFPPFLYGQRTWTRILWLLDQPKNNVVLPIFGDSQEYSDNHFLLCSLWVPYSDIESKIFVVQPSVWYVWAFLNICQLPKVKQPNKNKITLLWDNTLSFSRRWFSVCVSDRIFRSLIDP